jgi:hypothetical protein
MALSTVVGAWRSSRNFIGQQCAVVNFTILVTFYPRGREALQASNHGLDSLSLETLPYSKANTGLRNYACLLLRQHRFGPKRAP